MLTTFLSVRVPMDDLALLDELGERTSRSRSDVIRYLIRHARFLGQPDIMLDGVEILNADAVKSGTP
jgi:predicted transcriptional regulator